MDLGPLLFHHEAISPVERLTSARRPGEIDLAADMIERLRVGLAMWRSVSSGK
jgi:hypothetical protein